MERVRGATVLLVIDLKDAYYHNDRILHLEHHLNRIFDTSSAYE